MTARDLRTERGPWSFRWDGYSRLADVWHAEVDHAVDCVQVVSYDWTRGVASPGAAADLESAADKWMESSSEDYQRELPWL